MTPLAFRVCALLLAAAPPSEVAEQAQPASAAAVQRAVTHASAALVARDLPEAARQLDVAQQNVRAPDELAEVKRLRAAAEQLRLFFDAVRAGLAKHKPGEKITVAGVEANVVAVRPDSVTLSFDESKRSFAIRTMPAAMALFLARLGADEKQPEAAAFFGAFEAIDPAGNREKAGALLRRAAAGGAAVEDLLPLVEGPPLAARREPVPDARLVEAAATSVLGPVADLIVSAESGPAKSRVAKSLLAAARRADNSPEQYAALDQAHDWAVSAGDPMTALAALEDMGRWFDVDALELKSKALGAALAGTVSSESAVAAATAALALSVEAEQAGRDELALTLADIAYGAARKSHENDMIKRAYQRRSEMSAKLKSGGAKRASPKR